LYEQDFPPVMNTRATQLELAVFVFFGMLSIFVLSREGREDHSNKPQLSDVLEIFIVDDGVQSGRKQRTGKRWGTGRTIQQ